MRDGLWRLPIISGWRLVPSNLLPGMVWRTFVGAIRTLLASVRDARIIIVRLTGTNIHRIASPCIDECQEKRYGNNSTFTIELEEAMVQVLVRQLDQKWWIGSRSEPRNMVAPLNRRSELFLKMRCLIMREPGNGSKNFISG